MAGRNLNTDFSVAPYFDDYDEAKKFLRILFRPSFPVQVRELTQLQTILNNQIGRLGSSIYKDGTPVTGSNLSITDVIRIELDSSADWSVMNNLIVPQTLGSGYSLNDELLIENGADQAIVRLGLAGTYSFSLINNITPFGFFGKISTTNFNVTSGAKGAQFEVNAKVSISSNPADDATDDREERPVFLVTGFTTATGTENASIFGEYLTGTEFQSGDELFIYNDANNTYSTSLGTLGDDFDYDSLLASVDEGVFYSNNFFILIDQQTTLLSNSTYDVNARIGFSVLEDIVTERGDETLLDNSAGSPNENAPGAHRYRLKLRLTYKTIDPNLSSDEYLAQENFYEIGRTINGQTIDRQERPKYSTLGSELAKRTHDINGNFIVEPFILTYGDKKLFEITFLTVSGTNATIQTSVLGLTTEDIKDRTFVLNNRIYKIQNATNPDTFDDEFFSISLQSVPDFVDLEGETVEIYDTNVYELSFSSGKAYVEGYEFSTLGTLKRTLEKTQTAKHVRENIPRTISTSFGNYLVIDEPATTLAISETNIGSEITFFGDTASIGEIGTARLKQVKKSTSGRMEVYFFNPSFTNRTVTMTASDVTSGADIELTAAPDGIEGATFAYGGVRYRIKSVSGTTATLTTDVASTIPGDTVLTLSFSISSVKSIEFSGGTGAEVSSVVQSDSDGDGFSETHLINSDKRRLVFPLSEFVVKDVVDAQYTYLKTESISIDSSGETNITLLGDSSESLSPDFSQYYIQLSDGSVVDTNNISISGGFGLEDGNITISGVTSTTATAIIPIVRNPANNLTTSIDYGNTEEISAALLASDTSSYVDTDNNQVRVNKSVITATKTFYDLGVSDVLNVRGIYELLPDDSETPPTTTDFKQVNVTDRYSIDYGQRESSVEYLKIALKAGYQVSENDILVIFDRLRTDPTTEGDATFYSPDSYDEFEYEYLLRSEAFNTGIYDPVSMVDFRPRAMNLSGATDLSNITKTYNQNVYPPTAYATSTFQADMSYYMPRIDKATISPDLEFRIIQGTPNEEPKPPDPEDRSLPLYDLILSSFSITDNDIESVVFENNNYTMKDISEIENRLTRLEKSVQLDRVEKAILSSEIKDSSNTNLFKTGVFVDTFSSMDNAAVSDSDYMASIDTAKGELRPAIDQYSFSLDYQEDDLESTAKITDDDILFPQYLDTPVTVVTQTLATRTENVNPFAIMDWVGELNLKPEKDFWQDVSRRPDVTTDMSGSNKAWAEMARNASRTEWGSWNTRWSGKWRTTDIDVDKSIESVGVRRNTIVDVDTDVAVDTEVTTERRNRGWFGWRDVEVDVETTTTTRTTNTTRNTILDTTTRTTVNREQSRDVSQSRRGIQTTFSTKLEKKNLGDRIVDQSVIPIMRSVPGGIQFRATALKPDTIVYPFFDEVSILNNVRPGIIIGVDRDLQIGEDLAWNATRVNRTTATLTNGGNSYTVTITGKSRSINTVYFHCTPSSRNSDAYTESTFTSLNVAGYNLTTVSEVVPQVIAGTYRLKTDPTGSVSGIFDVPLNTFKTGTRNFKVIDTANGDIDTSNTQADKDFEASGIRQVVQRNIVTTRTPTVKKRNVNQNRVITDRRTLSSSWTNTSSELVSTDVSTDVDVSTSTRSKRRPVRWKDPLAETFLIDAEAYPAGLFLHSVDLWITSRDSSIPITVQIRPVNNGYPDSSIVFPFGEVHLFPEEVTIANTPKLSNYTRFTFSTPIFLQPGEYSFVIMANSTDYEVYTARMGENILDVNSGIAGNRVMNKQPFAGVMFKSQNASTWTAYQEEDIMFRLNRAQFVPGEYTAIFNTTFDNSQLRTISPFKEKNKFFEYDPALTNSKFSYNLFQINVPQVRDFESVIDPVYEYKAWRFNEATNEVTENINYLPIEVNNTKVSENTLMMKYPPNDTTNYFKVRLTYGTNSTVVAPFVDVQQMNTIFIQNLIDEAQLRRNQITIVTPGSGYLDGETVEILNTDDEQIGKLEVTTLSGVVTDVDFLEQPKYVMDQVSFSDLVTASGSGLQIESLSETDSDGGIATARYISETVSLKSGFDSQDLKITTSAYRPEGTRLYAYYKVKSAEDTDFFRNKPWNLMYELSNPDDYSVKKTDQIPVEFVTYKTQSDGTVVESTKGGTFYTNDGTTYETFNMYAIKIVMTSEETQKTPILFNVGAIALIEPIEPRE